MQCQIVIPSAGEGHSIIGPYEREVSQFAEHRRPWKS